MKKTSRVEDDSGGEQVNSMAAGFVCERGGKYTRERQTVGLGKFKAMTDSLYEHLCETIRKT